ncbi:hypothetical protein PHYSODRAFT_527293 [Phytophthora sojae]|uniref:Uncharacterized protein n=1 Tax=Phytophthora sojae (strain P6497) TaxID=1094619 RepID=G5A7G7_PHYSP|nr:hypothetical protein PHYSODRAFT_527293 [Phytophthora sojae]EGZ07846.1 hypothetical protein PHYSODRAFT_527293 [Phytophthora sojae]|eukprot:XP_009536018.1 hypothetical protein PHYSODRAFT_527293 [Phytophthora sojae]
MNATMTELTMIQRCTGSLVGYSRHARATEEAWRSTHKLGSLLGDSEDLTRRKILAAGALRRLWTIWIRPQYVSDATRVRLYNYYVLPVLLYNSGTWALTPSELSGLESFHRRQLRSERPLRHRITATRWRLFGHILRRPEIPAYTQMAAYFDSPSKGTWRGRPRTTLPTVLDADLISSGYAYRLETRRDLDQLRLLAQEKPKWKALERAIVAALPAKKDPTYADTTLCRRLAKLSLATA